MPQPTGPRATSRYRHNALRVVHGQKRRVTVLPPGTSETPEPWVPFGVELDNGCVQRVPLPATGGR